MRGHWRKTARAIIREVLEQTRGQPEKDVRRAIRQAYPFGERAMHPYKIWLDEVQRQLGTKKPKHTCPENNPNQLSLFTF